MSPGTVVSEVIKVNSVGLEIYIASKQRKRPEGGAEGRKAAELCKSELQVEPPGYVCHFGLEHMELRAKFHSTSWASYGGSLLYLLLDQCHTHQDGWYVGSFLSVF